MIKFEANLNLFIFFVIILCVDVLGAFFKNNNTQTYLQGQKRIVAILLLKFKKPHHLHMVGVF